MKIISLLLICITSLNAFRSQPSLTGAKDAVIDKFAGIWKWNGKNETFTIKLVKVPARYIYGKLDTTDRHVIIGWHQFEVGSQLVESTLNAVSDSLNTSTTIRGYTLSDRSIEMIFNDLTHNRTFAATLTLLPGSNNKAIWTATILEKFLFKEDLKYPKGQTVPNNIVLKKEDNSGQ